jgi:hypothetical protein
VIPLLRVRLTYGLTLEQKSLARRGRRLLLRRRGDQGLRGGWSDLHVATLAGRAARQIAERILQLSEFLVPESVGLREEVRSQCRVLAANPHSPQPDPSRGRTFWVKM